MRKRIADRLGPDWIDVLADQIKARRERAAAARTNPLTVAQARIVRLDNEMNGPMPRPITPGRQRRNRALLAAATQTRSSRRRVPASAHAPEPTGSEPLAQLGNSDLRRHGRRTVSS
ncbi:hypothetical protein ACIP5U_34270 [Streptomyces sp. NPDC088788]|uniref:hypothetical protein n=1 Tax=Streptomyces sp. NPDC088788 TaxID=3365898 RepID=UPI00380DA40E